MTSPKPHLPQAGLPTAITLGVRVSEYELGEGTNSPQQILTSFFCIRYFLLNGEWWVCFSTHKLLVWSPKEQWDKEVCFLSSLFSELQVKRKGNECTQILEHGFAEDRLGLLRPQLETRPELSIPHLLFWTSKCCLSPKRKKLKTQILKWFDSNSSQQILLSIKSHQLSCAQLLMERTFSQRPFFS